MPARVQSTALYGIDAARVDIEVDVLKGLPSFTVVGMTDKAIQESRERLTAALVNSDFVPPRRKTIVSLAPASVKKEGSLYDAPIALGFLVASKQIAVPDKKTIDTTWVLGELGLDGSIRPVRGALPIALAAARHGVANIVLPYANRHEVACIADRVAVYPVRHIREAIAYITGDMTHAVTRITKAEYTPRQPLHGVDMSHIAGQDHAKRALAVCAAGGHNALLIGPPGTGKTLLAKAMVGILPPLSQDESFVTSSIHSVAGLLQEGSRIMYDRPFRSPHHGASSAALVGGGAAARPGEVSLAHGGVLFLDEMPEFQRSVLEQLRQPIEDGYVTIARAAQTTTYPAKSIVVGAMNPCPCGYAGSTKRTCSCSARDMFRYQRKISGPLMDRFDLHVLVDDVTAEDLLDDTASAARQSSADIAADVANSRQTQLDRQGVPNGELSAKQVQDICVLDAATKTLLIRAQEKFGVSSRAVHRIMKVARTIADMDSKDAILPSHISEALQYREQLSSVLPEFV